MPSLSGLGRDLKAWVQGVHLSNRISLYWSDYESSPAELFLNRIEFIYAGGAKSDLDGSFSSDYVDVF